MALMQTLEDQFFGTVIDPKWTLVGGTPTNFIKQQNGQIELSSDGISGNYYTLQSTATYDLTGSFAFVKVVSVGSQAANFDCLPILLQDVGTTNKLWWDVGGNTLAAFKLVAGAQTSILTTPFNATTHKWLRIRESGGTTFWDYTSDPNIGWTNFTSQSNPITVTALEGCIQVGQFGAAAADTLKVDSFNFNNPQMWIGNYQGGQVWRKKRRRFQRKQYFYPTPLLVNQVATPPTAALTITTFAPVVSTPRLVTPGKLSLIITPFIPTARAPRLATPGKLSLTITTFAPVVSAPRLVTPGKLSLILTTFAPTKLINNTRTPPTRTLTLTTFAPTVSAPRLVTPGKLALVLTTFIPLATNSRTVTINTLALTLTPYAPSIPPKYASIGTIITSSNRGEAVNTGISVAEIASSGTLETVPSSTNTSQVDSSETDEVISGTNTNTSI